MDGIKKPARIISPPDPRTLTQRLRGIYILPINDGVQNNTLDGKKAFRRDFAVKGLTHEAAEMIESLEAHEFNDRHTVEDMIKKLLTPADPLGSGQLIVVPIRREAAERLQSFL